jgi:hypothetical protein
MNRKPGEYEFCFALGVRSQKVEAGGKKPVYSKRPFSA